MVSPPILFPVRPDRSCPMGSGRPVLLGSLIWMSPVSVSNGLLNCCMASSILVVVVVLLSFFYFFFRLSSPTWVSLQLVKQSFL